MNDFERSVQDMRSLDKARSASALNRQLRSARCNSRDERFPSKCEGYPISDLARRSVVPCYLKLQYCLQSMLQCLHPGTGHFFASQDETFSNLLPYARRYISLGFQ